MIMATEYRLSYTADEINEKLGKIDNLVSPITKTEDMTQPVGVDENGQLWVAPVGGGSGIEGLTVESITIGESVNIPVTGVSLDYTSVELEVGQGMQLACSVIPNNATNNAVVWTSSDSTKVKVEEGYITALASGNCTIKAISAENSNIYATCAVVVEANGTGGEDTPTEPTNKVMFSTLTPVKEGVVLKKDGKTEYADSKAKGYYQLPYSEGMKVSTVIQTAWASNYPPFLIVDNGVATIPEYVKTDASPSTIYLNYTATLTGLSNTAVIYANVAWANVSGVTDEQYLEHCYYIVGGAE